MVPEAPVPGDHSVRKPHPDNAFSAASASLADGASLRVNATTGVTTVISCFESPLTLTVLRDQHAVVSYLLSRGANPSGRPLVLACGQKSAALVQLLLTAECDVNAPASVNGETPLFYAIASDVECADKVEALLGQRSLDLTVTNRFGLLAEDAAAVQDKPDIALFISDEVSASVRRRVKLLRLFTLA